MKKKLFLLFIILVVIVFVVFYYTQLIQRPKISNTLSDRAKTFIEKQKKLRDRSDSELKNINLTGPVGEDTRNKRIGRDGCYSFIIPYRVSVTKYEDTSGNECSARFSFDNPKGSVFTYIYKKSVSSWDDISGVTFRRRKTDEYTEEKKTINGRTFLMFLLKDSLYEKNVFYYESDFFFVFNFITKTNENLDAELEGMLASLQFE